MSSNRPAGSEQARPLIEDAIHSPAANDEITVPDETATVPVTGIADFAVSSEVAIICIAIGNSAPYPPAYPPYTAATFQNNGDFAADVVPAVHHSPATANNNTIVAFTKKRVVGPGEDEWERLDDVNVAVSLAE
jgi:hypothetical protein